MVHSVGDETRGGGEAVQVKISGNHLGVFFLSPDIIVLRAHSSAPIAHLYTVYTKEGVGMRRERSACAFVYARKGGKRAEERKKN